MRRIGFFGGSFDPIHNGHLNLAIQLFEIHRLDEILFCPAFCSPFKEKTPPIASAQHRLAMLRCALKDLPFFRITDAEIRRGGLSYTVDTLRFLLKEERAQFHLLLSEEAAAHVHSWKEARELLQLAPPLIGMRSSASSFSKGGNADSLQQGITLIRIMEISSSEIRERMKKKLYCRHLIPKEVVDYIEQHTLYFL